MAGGIGIGEQIADNGTTGSSSSGGITDLTSSGGSITITSPTGPTTNVEVSSAVEDSSLLYLHQFYR